MSEAEGRIWHLRPEGAELLESLPRLEISHVLAYTAQYSVGAGDLIPCYDKKQPETREQDYEMP